MEITLDDTNLPLGNGSMKIAYDLNDGFVVLCPKKQSDAKILKELEMIQYLASLGLPVIDNIIPVTVSSKFGKYLGLHCRKIRNATLYKPFSSSPVKLSKANICDIKNIQTILLKNKLAIVDLQLLYNDEELYIIDPSNLYNVETFHYIGHHPKRKHIDLLQTYVKQNRTLQRLIDFNFLSPV